MTFFEATMLTLAVAIGLAAIAFWFAMIRRCWRHSRPGSRERWVWLMIIVLGKIPGALGYYLLHRNPA